MFPSRKEIEDLRASYPVGTRIQLIEMRDPHCPVPSGTLGTVTYVDDAGTIHMKWDNGRTLDLISDEDLFKKI